MAFTIIGAATPRTIGAPPPTNIQLSVNFVPNTKDRRFNTFRFGTGLLTTLGWVAGANLECAWGTGEDFGKLQLRRIAPDILGHKLKITKTGYGRLSLPEHVDQNIDGVYKNVNCQYTIGGEGDRRLITITLPMRFLKRVI